MTGNYLPLREAMDQLFAGSFIAPHAMGGQGGFPPANVRVTDDEIVIEMAAAGADPDDVTIALTGNTVTISGEVTREEHDTKGQTYVEEIWVGSFQRSFTLPFPVDVDRANASFENGILRLTLPKSEAAKPRRVQVSSRGTRQGQKQVSQQDGGRQNQQAAGQQNQQSGGQQNQSAQQTDSGVQKERVPTSSGKSS